MTKKQLGGPYGGEVVLWTYFKYKTHTHIYIYIWANYNISLTWIKAVWGWFPLLTIIPVRSQWGRYNLPRYIYNSIFIQIIIKIIHVVYNDTTNLHNSLELSHNPGKLGKILETTRTCSWGYKRATLPYLLPINQNHARICSLDSGIGSISTINLSSTKFPAVNIIFGGFGLLSTIPDQDHPGDFWSRLQVQQLVQLILAANCFPGVPSGTACHFKQDQKKHLKKPCVYRLPCPNCSQ